MHIRRWPTRIISIQQPHILTIDRINRYPNRNQEEHHSAEDCIKRVGIMGLSSASQEDLHGLEVEDQFDTWQMTGETRSTRDEKNIASSPYSMSSRFIPM